MPTRRQRHTQMYVDSYYGISNGGCGSEHFEVGDEPQKKPGLYDISREHAKKSIATLSRDASHELATNMHAPLAIKNGTSKKLK